MLRFKTAVVDRESATSRFLPATSRLPSSRVEDPRSFASSPRIKRTLGSRTPLRRYDFVEMHPLNSARGRGYENEREEAEEEQNARWSVAEEAQEEETTARRSGAATEPRRKSPRRYGITGKSAINQGSPGTELGNCLLKNRNDVNPGVPASQPGSQRAGELPLGARTDGNPGNKTDSAKERSPGGIMRNKINVTQSRLSFEISLPVFAADKCSIYTDYLYTEAARLSNSPSVVREYIRRREKKATYEKERNESTDIALVFDSRPRDPQKRGNVSIFTRLLGC